MKLTYEIVGTRQKDGSSDFVTDFVWKGTEGEVIRDDGAKSVADCIDWYVFNDGAAIQRTVKGYDGGVPSDEQIAAAITAKKEHIEKNVLPKPGVGLSLE